MNFLSSLGTANGNEEEQHSSFLQFSRVLHTRHGENNDEEAMHELKHPGGHAIEEENIN
jgi:hypothetical protein